MGPPEWVMLRAVGAADAALGQQHRGHDKGVAGLKAQLAAMQRSVAASSAARDAGAESLCASRQPSHGWHAEAAVARGTVGSKWDGR